MRTEPTGLAAQVLKALGKATAQQPMDAIAIAARVTHAMGNGSLPAMAMLQTTLDDLEAAQAINSARVGADPQTLKAVYWPTGVPPQAIPRKAFTINAFSRADAARAVANDPVPQPKEEPVTMPRIAAPAEPRPAPKALNDSHGKPYTTHAARAIEILARQGPTNSTQLKQALGVRNDLNKYIATPVMDGRITSRPNPQPGPGGYLVRAYMLTEQAADWDAAHPTPATATPPVGRNSAAPSAVPAAPATPAAPADNRIHMALWDDGEIHLASGDDIIRLGRADVLRLTRLVQAANHLSTEAGL